MMASGITLDTNDVIDCGVYADIFKPAEGPLVYKLFISFRHETTTKQGLANPEDDQRRRKTFDSECQAYEIAAQDAFLRAHIPRSFRRSVIADVVEHGESVATNYLPECCYAMEFVDGVATKLRAVEVFAHIKEAERAFHLAGINHTADASVFFAAEPEKFKFIDFAVNVLPPPSW